jgi:hypothetical protein
VPHSNCSDCRPPTTSFSAKPIGTVKTLARILQLSVEELQAITQSAEQRYRPITIRKEGGGVRPCHDALGVLKSIQHRIRVHILERVDYPPYLHGGIKDPVSPRGQKANAERHVNPGCLVTVDIRNFYLSVDHQFVFQIFQRFFRFPPAVAEILTTLTTKGGCLPQGSKTSDLLANLVFWDIESQLVADFHERSITYTRLMDDISCSTKSAMTHDEMSYILTHLSSMVRRKGLRLHPKKKTIARGNQQQVTTKLVVNRKTALTPKLRSAIRSEVRALEKMPLAARTSKEYTTRYRRASGRIAYMKQHHPAEADQLRAKLKGLPAPAQH